MECRRYIMTLAMISLSLSGYIDSTGEFEYPQLGQFNDLENVDDMGTYSDEIDADSVDISDSPFIQNDKRMPSFSVNGGLRSLTDMLYSKQRANVASGRSGIRNRLLKLGKRQSPYMGDETKMSSDLESLYTGKPVSKRRSQLSVSGPLSALANMLAAEGRRREFSESRHNRMRLLEIGKRSVNTGPMSKSSSFIEKFSDSSNGDMH